MSKNSPGSLGYQMMKALQRIFQPGASRHTAKRYRRDRELITGISTMRCMSADVHQFARFIRINWPEVKHLSEVRPEMALAYIEELEAARAVRWKDCPRLRLPAQAGHRLPQGRHLPSRCPTAAALQRSGRTRRVPLEAEAHRLHRRASPGDHRAYHPTGSHRC